MADNAAEFSLDFTYEGAKAPTLHELKGEVRQGRCIVLCGSSGCGKSTVLRCLNQLIPQFYEGKLSGFRFLQGQNLEDLTIGETGKIVSSVFQDPRSQFFALSTDAEAAFGLENNGLSHDKMQERVNEAFETFQMKELRHRSVFSLSSGERQMTAILSAWAMNTDIFLFDEPTANLDAASVLQLTTALQNLKSQGKTMLVSEHRLFYLRDIADEFWLMEDGRIKKRYTAEEMNRLSSSQLHQMGLRVLNPDDIHRQWTEPCTAKTVSTLSLNHLRFCYQKNGKEVLKDISLQAQTGEVVGLVGHNGCGKTTLGKLAAGLFRPVSGTISLDGKRLSHRALSRESLFIMQEAELQFFTDSVMHELTFGRQMTETQQSDLEHYLKMTDLWNLRDRHPFSLSGGQMQKLVMLIACLTDKPVIILDEPTAGLDHRSLTVCASLIKRMKQDHIVLLISHDPELLAMVCTRAVFLNEGLVQEDLPVLTDQDFSLVQEKMKQITRKKPVQAETAKTNALRLDPRCKLLFLLFAMVIGVCTDLHLILCVQGALIIAFLYEGRWKHALSVLLSLGSICLLYALYPNVGTSFIAHFFPRIILIGSGMMLASAPDDLQRMLAGLHSLHVPEKAIMITSVIFRFFPVLRSDFAIMRQSFKTRDVRLFQLHSPITTLEIMIVPMVFRVLRIAETLSASAETRGISLSVRRESYACIRWSCIDSCMTVLLALCTVIGLLI